MKDVSIEQISVKTATYECHHEFIEGLEELEGKKTALWMRGVARRSGIEKRHTVLNHLLNDREGNSAFYKKDHWPSTAERLLEYRKAALPLALETISGLDFDPLKITHLFVVSCTGYYAPGLDMELVEALGLKRGVYRSVFGHMGCGAALPALRSAVDGVRSRSGSQVLIICLELCSLHRQPGKDKNACISSLLFADGCSAALVGEEKGLCRLDHFETTLLENCRDRMSWYIGDQGFAMTLDTEVPDLIASNVGKMIRAEDKDIWAVHPGGKAILDAMQESLGLAKEKLFASRRVLRECGNMSSATVLFVLKELIDSGEKGSGVSLAFGPGLTLERMDFQVD